MGSVAQYVLSEGKTGSTDQVRWSWGFGVAFGVYVSGGVSGRIRRILSIFKNPCHHQQQHCGCRHSI